jgi:hypothetical protein
MTRNQLVTRFQLALFWSSNTLNVLSVSRLQATPGVSNAHFASTRAGGLRSDATLRSKPLVDPHRLVQKID